MMGFQLDKDRRPAPKDAKRSSSNLRVGEPDDAFERQADQVAEEIMSGQPGKLQSSFARIGVGAPLQRKCPCGGPAEGECEDCKKEKLQRKADGPANGGQAPAIVSDVLRSAGEPLHPEARQFFEPRFGFDFSKVRVHIGERAAESAKAVQARAYTVGNHLVFAGSEYDPRSAPGRKLLSHELAHVVQQSGGDPKQAAAPRSVQWQCTPTACPAVTVPLPSVEARK